MKKMMSGAVLLTAASFIAKLLSAVYRVPFQNMVGNTGFYAYQQVYPLYGLGMTLALNGLPIFLSKVVAESSSSLDQKATIKKMYHLLSLLAIVLFLFLYAGSGFIGEWMGDRALQKVVQAVSWQFLLIPFLAVSRGYFQGNFQMTPTAVSQVIEQVVRVTVILIAAYSFSLVSGDIYQMAASAMSSAWIAAVAASLVMGIYLFFYRKKQKIQPAATIVEKKTEPSYRYLARRLGTEGLTICLLSAMLILFQLIDSFTLYKGLVESGTYAAKAKDLKGIYDRGQPLVQLGMVAATAFSSSLLPMLTAAVVQKKAHDFYRYAASFLRITATVAAAATTGMIVLLPYLNHTLFGDKAGDLALSIYMLAIFLASLIGAVNAILQSQDYHRVAFVGLLLGLIGKLFINPPLVVLFGINGSSLGTVFGLLLSLVFIWFKLDQPIRQVWRKKQFGLKLGVSCFIMSIGVWGTTRVLAGTGIAESREGSFVLALAGVGIGMGLFVKWIIHIKLLTLREWLSLPLGKRLLRK